MEKLKRRLRTIGIIIIIAGIIFGISGVKSYLRDDAYAKASVVSTASVKSAEIKPMSGKAVGSIRLILTYVRDGVADSTELNFAEAYSDNNPLPTEVELKAVSYYVRYVPKEKRSENIPNWVMVNRTGEFEGFYGRSSFGQMFTLILLGFMVRMFGRKKSV